MCAEKRSKPSKSTLDEYYRKRRAGGTPEPMGREGTHHKSVFVIHKHAASRLHYDLRLEHEGVLLSWAIPRGLPLKRGDKHLAVETEPHPVEYIDFEGVIPKGNYGAGEMIVWDRGVWSLIEEEGYTFEQKVTFELRGHKLRGRWSLVKIKSDDDTVWLALRKGDEVIAPPDEGSILSGLTIEDMRHGDGRAAEIRADLEARGVEKRTVRVGDVKTMNAERAKEPPMGHPGWVFEVKYDGYRVLAGKEDTGDVRLLYRSGRETTRAFPEVALALERQPYSRLVLDAEIVVLDDEARPSFQKLQKRAQLSRRSDIERASVLLPAVLYVFDVLAFEDYDLRGLPLLERKAILRRLLPKSGPLRYADHFPTEVAPALFETVRSWGLEGLMAKRADGQYIGGRSSEWLKVIAELVGDFVVVGYTRAEGSRSGFGSLHLAVWEQGGLVYAGRVGGGFKEADLTTIRALLDGSEIDEPACTGALPKPDQPGRWSSKIPDSVWVEPRQIVQVRFKTWTGGGNVRHPVFERLRTDKPMEDCHRVAGGTRHNPEEPEGAPQAIEAEDPRHVPYTNRSKVFWPDAGYTKGQLIDYYLAVAPWLLPYLKDRPLVMTRYPDGIDGKSFFQKDAPGYLPDWMRRERMWSEHTDRHIDYLVVDSAEGLGYVANMGSIPIHIWSSRTTDLPHPDWCIIDLDPKEAPFSDVLAIALAVHALCDEIGLPHFVKTSGSTGLHILVPLGGQCTYEQCRMLGNSIAGVIMIQLPDISTTIRNPARRGGKVYIDIGQNRHGALIVSPFCARPRPGAPVSMPLHWDEVDDSLHNRNFTIANAIPRLEAIGHDPLREVLNIKPDLQTAIMRLLERMA